MTGTYHLRLSKKNTVSDKTSAIKKYLSCIRGRKKGIITAEMYANSTKALRSSLSLNLIHKAISDIKIMPVIITATILKCSIGALSKICQKLGEFSDILGY